MSDRESLDEVRAVVKDAFESQLKSVVEKAVDDAVGVAVDRAVGIAVDRAVGVAVDRAVGVAVDRAVDRAVGIAVDGRVNDKINDAVREIRAGQRWGIGITLAVILGVLSIGTPLVVGRITAEIRASTAEAEADHVEEIARYDERLKAVEKAVE